MDFPFPIFARVFSRVGDDVFVDFSFLFAADDSTSSLGARRCSLDERLIQLAHHKFHEHLDRNTRGSSADTFDDIQSVGAAVSEKLNYKIPDRLAHHHHRPSQAKNSSFDKFCVYFLLFSSRFSPVCVPNVQHLLLNILTRFVLSSCVYKTTISPGAPKSVHVSIRGP